MARFLFGAAIFLGASVASADCECDFNGDGLIGVDDQLILIANWGTANSDCTGDGMSNVDDLLEIFAGWGPCVLGDDCEDAIEIDEGQVSFNITNATTDPDDPAWSCLVAPGPDVWYEFVPWCNGNVTAGVQTFDPAFDPAVQVFEVNEDGSIGAEVACNDDEQVCAGPVAVVYFDAVANQRYKIRVGGADGTAGSGTLSVLCGWIDYSIGCSHFREVEVGGVVNKSTSGVWARFPVEFCSEFFSLTGCWYTVTGDGTTLTASTCNAGTEFDTRLFVYCGDCIVQYCVGDSDDAPGCGDASSVTWCSEIDVTYYMLVGSNDFDEHGRFVLTVDSDGVPCKDPPICDVVCGVIINDCCEDAISIDEGVTPYDTTGANTDGAAESDCQYDGQTYHDIWFHYVASCSGLLELSTCDDADYDTDLVVYDGCGSCDDLNLLGCNDDGLGCSGFTSRLSVPVIEGNCYTVRVGGWNDGDQGTANLTIGCELACVFECPVGASFEDAFMACPVDGDDPFIDPNGGCMSGMYGALDIGETVCGQVSSFVADNGFDYDDEDWYVFTLDAPMQVFVTCEAQFPADFGISETGVCLFWPDYVKGETLGDCDQVTISAVLLPGSYTVYCTFPHGVNVPCGAGPVATGNDYFLTLTAVPLCSWDCPPGATFECGPQQCPVDGDDEDDDGNGGCAMPVPAFCSIECGETICGAVSNYSEASNFRATDRDWYEFVADASGSATATLSGRSPCIFGFADHQDGACPVIQNFDYVTTDGNCDERSVTVTGLTPGLRYAIFVAAPTDYGAECSIGQYWLRLDCP